MNTVRENFALNAIYGGIALFFCIFLNVNGYSALINPEFIKNEILPSFIPVTPTGMEIGGKVVITLGFLLGLYGLWLIGKGLIGLKNNPFTNNTE